MSRNIPFFEMFTELQLSPELRLKLAGAELTGAAIDQGEMSIRLQLTVKSQLSEADAQGIRDALRAVYGFSRVEMDVTCKAPEAARPEPAASASKGGKGGRSAVGKVLMGNPIKARPGPIRELDLKMSSATVAGKVFFFECRETRRPGMWRLSFDMTDYTGSVTVQKNLTAREAQALESAVKPGMWLCVQGKMEPTWDGKDIQLNPYHTSPGRTPPRRSGWSSTSTPR